MAVTSNNPWMEMNAAHSKALAVVREHGAPENDDALLYLDMVDLQPSSAHYPIRLASAQSVLMGALAEIIRQQDRRITELETVRTDETL